MLELFGKKEDRLKECAAKEDWTGVAKAYYDLGKSAMSRGELEKAMLWLCRADTVYSASDEIYEQAGKKRLFRKELTEDCSDRIGDLEEADLLYNRFPAEAEEKAAELDGQQLRMWDLLSIARLTGLWARLGKLPGCEVLGELGWAVETVLKSFRAPIQREEFGRLSDFCNGLYEFGDSAAFYGRGGEIEVPGGPSFQVFDLNGMTGVHLGVYLFLDSHLQFLSALSQGEVPPESDETLAGCTLLPDYYVRTNGGKLEDIPQIRAEMERIWADWAFVQTNPSWEDLAFRVERYQALDILQK